MHAFPSQRFSNPEAAPTAHPRRHHQLTEGMRQWCNEEANAKVNSWVVDPCSRPKLFKYVCTYASVRRYSTDSCSRTFTDLRVYTALKTSKHILNIYIMCSIGRCVVCFIVLSLLFFVWLLSVPIVGVCHLKWQSVDRSISFYAISSLPFLHLRPPSITYSSPHAHLQFRPLNTRNRYTQKSYKK